MKNKLIFFYSSRGMHWLWTNSARKRTPTDSGWKYNKPHTCMVIK